ncbi:MAG: head-tail connector protein [Elusimicrobiales bacterium]|nr:head-tail connector protein [Elusimicrobiales bacterium]
MPLKLKTAPTIEPISLAEQKLHSKVDFSDDDALISAYITAARQHIEDITGVRMITQTWQLMLDRFPGYCFFPGEYHEFQGRHSHDSRAKQHQNARQITIPIAPVINVSSVSYYDDTGAAATFGADNFIVDTVSIPARIALKHGKYWPQIELQSSNGVVIEFVAGYGPAVTDVPEPLRAAIRLLAAHFYKNREAVVIGAGSLTVQELPMGVEQLISSYHMWQR